MRVDRYVEGACQAGVAEMAVVIADELQSMSIGTGLTTRKVERALLNGLTLLTATTLWENRPARALPRRLAFRASPRRRDRAAPSTRFEPRRTLDYGRPVKDR